MKRSRFVVPSSPVRKREPPSDVGYVHEIIYLRNITIYQCKVGGGVMAPSDPLKPLLYAAR